MIKFIIGLVVLSYASVIQAEQYLLEDIIEKVNPSVVSIAADLPEEQQALGSGMIVSADGYVVTNAHVTEGARKILLSTIDGNVYEADLVGADAKTDIALLKAHKPMDFKPAQFGNSDEVRVGNSVFVIGNPFGLGNSASLGIISAKERDIEKGPYDNFLQTDAAINQGNSGGPLFNLNGEVIGMSTAIFSEDGNNGGVGFATPSNLMKWVVEQLKNKGKVIRGWLGLSVQKVYTKSQTRPVALVVSAMTEDSPAAKAGLKVGDVILALGEVPLDNPRVFSLEVAKITPQTMVPMIIERDGQQLDVQVEISEMPTVEIAVADDGLSEEQPPIPNFAELNIDKYSVTKAENFPALGFKAYFDDAAREFVIVELSKNSEAMQKGIKVGDRFAMVDNKKIFGSEDLRIKIKQAQTVGQLVLSLKDMNGIYAVTLNLRSENDQN